MFSLTAPYRIDIGGGVTDIPEIGNYSATSVVNIGLDVYLDLNYTQPANVKFEFNKNKEKGILLIFNNKTTSLSTSTNDPLNYIKYFLNTRLLNQDLIIKIDSNLPSSTGLGGSSVFSTCLAGVQIYLANQKVRPEIILRMAKQYESEEMNIKGGIQDYIGAYYGGLNLITFSDLSAKNLKNHNNNLGKRIRKDLVSYLNSHMYVILLKNPRISSDKIVIDEIKNVKHDPLKYKPYLKTIADTNNQIFDLINSDGDLPTLITKIGNLISVSWRSQKALSKYISGEKLNKIEKELTPFCNGIRGPGAGANSLFIISKLDQESNVMKILNKYIKDIYILPLRVNTEGIRITLIH